MTTEATDIEITSVATTSLAPLDQALSMIDEGLGGLTDRQLVSAAEVTDLLLDVRSLLVPQPADA